MKVSLEHGELVLRPGGLRGITRVPLAELTCWDFLYEITGRRFIAFHLGDRTAYAQLPRLSVAERDALVAVRIVDVPAGAEEQVEKSRADGPAGVVGSADGSRKSYFRHGNR